jgi:hydroxymethylpyrimidine/phosphomethylpyrimidine kinase
VPAPAAFASALSIAGSDPTGGAGLQLDLQVFAAHGVHGMAVPTALTAQSTRGVERVLPVFPSVVTDQLRALLGDLRPDAIKLGMLATDDVLIAVAQQIEGLDVPLVIDPVLRASDGTPLLERRAWDTLRLRLVPGATLITPNLEEALLLTDESDPEAAARALLEAGAHAALVTGGHTDAAPDDYLRTPDGGKWLRGERFPGSIHGTGCALSAAITARLARGEPLESAVEGAKHFVARAIERSVAAGAGQRLLRLDFA